MTIARSVASSVAGPVARAVVGGVGGGFNAAADYFARVEAAGGSFDLSAVNATYTASYTKAIWNTFVRALQGSEPTINTASLDVWEHVFGLYGFAGVSNITGARIPVKRFGSDVLTGGSSHLSVGAGAGMSGTSNATTLFSDVGSDLSMWCWVSIAHSFGGGRSIMSFGPPAVFALDTSSYWSRRTTVTPITHPVGVTTGLFLVNGLDQWNGTTKQGSQVSGSQAPTADALQFLGTSNARIAVAGFGTQMTDPEVLALNECLDYLATQLGYA